MNKQRIVVYGGSGFFGRLLVIDLLKYSDAEIVIASRNPRLADFDPSVDRVKFVASNINDFASVAATIEGAKVAICCTGPFQGLTLNLLKACVEKGVNYIDVADDRDFIRRCFDLSEQIKQAGIIAFIGCSVVPGISSLLTKYCADKIGSVEKTRIFITPGTRHPRGPGSFLCLLSTVGKQYSISVDGTERMVSGWTGRERITFPPQIGSRWVYFVVDIADYFLQPIYFGTRTVEFKIGSEVDLLNRALTGLRLIKGALRVNNLNWIPPLARMLIYAASWVGTSKGAVMLEVSSPAATKTRKISLSVYAEKHGEVIPSVLASIAAQTILNAEIDYQGIVPLHSWLSKDKFIAELSKREIRLGIKDTDAGEWRLYSKQELAWNKS